MALSWVLICSRSSGVASIAQSVGSWHRVLPRHDRRWLRRLSPSAFLAKRPLKAEAIEAHSSRSENWARRFFFVPSHDSFISNRAFCQRADDRSLRILRKLATRPIRLGTQSAALDLSSNS